MQSYTFDRPQLLLECASSYGVTLLYYINLGNNCQVTVILRTVLYTGYIFTALIGPNEVDFMIALIVV